MRCAALAVISLSLLSGSAAAQSYVTSEQAQEAVRQFWADASLTVNVRVLYDVPAVGEDGPRYTLEVPAASEHAGDYEVDAVSGRVIFFLLEESHDDDPPQLDLATARGIAEQFATDHYPEFPPRQWYLEPERTQIAGGHYVFSWYWILNAEGTLAPYDLRIEVDGTTGNVVMYKQPPDNISAPMVPQITLAQALQIAEPFAGYDLTEVPFNENVLRIAPDNLDVQVLVWELSQVPDSTPDNPWPAHMSVLVDAITGVVLQVSRPFGIQTFPANGDAHAPSSPDPISIRTLRGEPVPCLAPPILHDGRLWVRAEMLRAFGAKVESSRQRLAFTVGVRHIGSDEVGAEWRNGWWVPLRRSANSFGWQVHWLALSREAVITGNPKAPGHVRAPDGSVGVEGDLGRSKRSHRHRRKSVAPIAPRERTLGLSRPELMGFALLMAVLLSLRWRISRRARAG